MEVNDNNDDEKEKEKKKKRNKRRGQERERKRQREEGQKENLVEEVEVGDDDPMRPANRDKGRHDALKFLAAHRAKVQRRNGWSEKEIEEHRIKKEEEERKEDDRREREKRKEEKREEKRKKEEQKRMEQKQREKEAYEMLEEKKRELEVCKRYAWETRHGNDANKRYGSSLSNYSSDPPRGHYHRSGHRGNGSYRGGGSSHRGRSHPGGALAHHYGSSSQHHYGSSSQHHYGSSSSLYNQKQQQHQPGRFRSRSPTHERGHFIQAHRDPQLQQEQRQHQRDPDLDQQQPRQQGGDSIAQELRQFMAEFRDALGTRRQDREQQPEEQ